MVKKLRAGVWGGPLILLCMVGCSGSDPSTAEAYPALAETYGLDSDDVVRIMTTSNGDKITADSVKSFVLGTIINRTEGTFINRPIFDIGALIGANLVDVNTSSSSQDYSRFYLKTDKEVTSDTSQFKWGVRESASFAGWSVQAAQEGETKSQSVTNNGSAKATFEFTRSSTTPTLKIMAASFKDPSDFSKYLVGAELNDVQLSAFVSGKTCSVQVNKVSYPYVCQIDIARGSTVSAENPYGRVQVIDKMLQLFSQAKDQHAKINDQKVRADLIATMRKLRASISEKVADFYAQYGQAFVSELYTMSSAIGEGDLTFEDVTTTSESRWGVSLGLNYQSFVAGAGASAQFSGLKAHGNTTWTKKVEVTARSQPSGVVDASQWAKDLGLLLNSESTTLTVPTLSGLPALPDVKLPEKALPKKPIEPPSNVKFTSYEDYKNARDQLRGEAGDQAAKQRLEQEAIKKAGKEVEEKGIDIEIPVEALSYPAQRSYADIAAEIERLEALRPRPVRASVPSNLMRIDKQFVSKFKTTDYAEVIPQLRPDLRIPGDPEESPSYYPNLTQLRFLVERADDAAAYLGFLSTLPAVSGVSQGGVADKFLGFNTRFRDASFKLIALTTSQDGFDLKYSHLAAHLAKWFGGVNGDPSESELYKALEDPDVYRFVRKTIFEPKNMGIWANASGGFIPFMFRADQNHPIAHYNVTGVGYANGKPYLKTRDDVLFENPSEDPINFYGKKDPDGKPMALQTPWFPVFRYNGSGHPTLLFVQMAGPNMIIYGRKFVVLPVDPAPSDSKTSPDFSNPAPVNPQARLSDAMINRLRDRDNSFLLECWDEQKGPISLNSDFSLYFPNTTADAKRAEKYRLLVALTGKNCMTSAETSPVENGYQAIDYMTGYKAFNVNGKPGHLTNQAGATEFFNRYRSQSTNAILLLPINATTVKPDNLRGAYRWGAPRNLDGLIKADDYKDLDNARFYR